MSAKNNFILLTLLTILISCKTNQTKNKLREGLWIETVELSDSITIKTKGRYRKGEPIRTWKYYRNNHIEKKEKYKENSSHITFYHENGKKQSEGNTKFVITEKETHWFYSGKWFFYNEAGKLDMIKHYENGEKISEEIVN